MDADMWMVLTKIAGTAVLLIVIVVGLSALARTRHRTLSPTIVLVAGVAFVLIGVRVVVGAGLLPAPSPRMSAVLVGASWFSTTFLVLKILDFLVIGEYLIDRHGVYLPDVVRVLIVGVGLFAAGLVILDVLLDINPVALVALPTVMTAIVGVALRDTLVRFFSGIALGKIVRIGDWVSVLDREGIVTGISFSHITLMTREQTQVTLPNDTVVHSTVTNYSRTPVHVCCLFVDALADVPPGKVSPVLVDAAKSVKGVLADPGPLVQVKAFKESSVQYQLKFAIADYGQAHTLESVVRTYVWNAFRREGIQIPSSQLVVHMDKGEASGAEVWLDEDEIVSHIREVDIFSILLPEQVTLLARSAKELHFLPGERLVRQGDLGEELFIILQGIVDVHVEVGGLSKVVNTLHQGQFFGEMSLLTGEPRSTTVVAQTPVRVLMIGKQSLSCSIEGNTELIHKIGALVVDRQLRSQAAREELNRERTNRDVTPETRSLIVKIQKFLWKRKESSRQPVT
jgi:small-conductance mechanosensitive channel/CRP-like cAMP-binding protein